MFIIDNTDNIHFTIWIFMLVLSGIFIFNFKFSPKKSLLELFILFYLFMSHTLVPILAQVGFLNININILYIQNNLSVYLYITFFIVYFFFNKVWAHSLPQKRGKHIAISKKWIYIFFVFIFLLSGISYILGLGKMGNEGVELPFKLTGIINTLRMTFAPFLFVILFDKIKSKETRRFLFMIVILFFIWCVFEAFIRLSRSAIVEYLIPFILYCIFCFNISFSRVLKYVLPLIILNVALFPLLTNLRQAESRVTLDAIMEASRSTSEYEQGGMYLRTFGNAKFIEKYIPYLSDDFFSFHNLPAIIRYRGTQNFTTVEVDGLFAILQKHNSGTTGISDALLIGGKGFAIITFAIACIIAIYFDSKKMQKRYLLRIFGFTIIRWLVMLRSWSLIFSPIVVVTLIVLAVLIKKITR